MPRCKCCDTTNQTYFDKDGFYCRKCLEVIKDTLKEYKYLDQIKEGLSGCVSTAGSKQSSTGK